MCIKESDQAVCCVLVFLLDGVVQSHGCQAQIPDGVLFISVRLSYTLFISSIVLMAGLIIL